MIYKLTNPFYINKIVDFSHEASPDIPKAIYKNTIINALGDWNSIVLISENKSKELNGFLYANVQEMDSKKVAFLNTVFVKNNEESILPEMLKKLNDWAKERDLKEIFTLTKRDYKAVERKYKFKLEYFLLKREVR